MLKAGRCKGCGAAVFWIYTIKGKWMITEREPMTICDSFGNVSQGYPVHWATCPEAKQFKKKKGE